MYGASQQLQHSASEVIETSLCGRKNTDYVHKLSLPLSIPPFSFRHLWSHACLISYPILYTAWWLSWNFNVFCRLLSQPCTHKHTVTHAYTLIHTCTYTHTNTTHTQSNNFSETKYWQTVLGVLSYMYESALVSCLVCTVGQWILPHASAMCRRSFWVQLL